MGIRERMMALQKRRYVTHTIEQIGEFAIQSMTEGERSKLDGPDFLQLKGLNEQERMAKAQEIQEQANARLIQQTQVTPDKHKRVWTDAEEDTAAIMAMDSQVIAHLVYLIDQHCGFVVQTSEEEKVAGKNSETTQDDTGPTLSLESAAG